MVDEFKVRISAEIDTKEAEKQIENLGKRGKVKAKVEVTGSKKVDGLTESIDNANRSAQNLDNSFRSISTAKLKYDAFKLIEQQCENAVTSVKQLNDAMTLVSMTMLDMPESNLKSLVTQSLDMAKELSTYSKTVTDAMTIYANANESVNSILEKSQPTVLLASASGMSASNAADSIQGILNQFDMADDKAMHVADSIEKLSSEISLDFSKGIGTISDAVSVGGSVMNEAGLSFEKYGAIVSATAEQTRISGSTLGNAFKTIASRITRSKTGEATTEDRANAEKAFNSIGVSIRGTDGDFQDLSITLDDLNSKWGSLNKSQKSYVAEQAAGVRNKNVFIAMMDTYNRALELEQEALDSEGTAMKINEKRVDSIDGKMQKLSATMTKLYTDAVSDDAIKGLLDFGTAAVEVADKLGLLQGTLAAVGAYGMGNIISKIAENWTTIAGIFTSPLGIGVAAVGGVTALLSAYRKAQKEALQAAQENANAYKESQNTIQSQIDRIKELREILANTDSEQEAYDAKAELLSIQQQLTESYGEEAAGISLVNGELDTQIGILQNLSKSKADAFLNENAAKIAEAEKELTKTLGGEGGLFSEAGEYLGTFYDNQSEETNKVKEIIDKYKDYLKVDDMQDGTFRIRFVGDAAEAQTVINDVMTDIRSAKDEIGESVALDEMFSNSGYVLDEAKEILDTYQLIYEQAQAAKLVADTSEYSYDGQKGTASKWLNDYSKAIEEYNAALASGDTSKIDEAANKFNTLDTAVQSLLSNSDMSAYADDFSTIKEQLDTAAIAVNDFKDALEGVGTSDSDKSIKGFADTIKNSGITDIDFRIGLESPSDETALNTAISGIASEAERAGISVDALISMLGELDVISIGVGENAEPTVESLSGTIEDFYNVLNNTEDGNFSESLDTYIEQFDTLSEAIKKFNSGELKESDITDLQRQFEGLLENSDDLGTGLENIFDQLLNGKEGSLDSLFDSMISDLGGAATEAGQLMAKLKSEYMDMYNTMLNKAKFGIDIDTETSKFSSMYGAAKNSRSATGLTNTDISNINSMYSGLESYNPDTLFERTEHGIHLNTKALRELNDEYETLNKSKIDSKLRVLRTEMNNLSAADTVQKKKLQDQIQELETLQSQYTGLTSSYNKWIQDQASGNERDMYENIGSGKDTIKDLIKRGWVGSAEVRDYVDLMSGKDLSTASVDEIMQAWEGLNSTIKGTDFTAFDFVTFDKDGKSTTDGIYNFFDAVSQTLGEGYAKLEGETYSFDFSNGKGAEVAERLGLDAEYIQSILRAAVDAGFDVDLNSAWEKDLDSVIQTVEDKRRELEELGTDPVKINLEVEAGADGDTSEIETEIGKVTAAIDEINKKEIKTDADLSNLELYNEELTILGQKLIEASQPAYMQIDTSSAAASMSECLGALQNYKQAENELALLKLNPSADTSQIELAEQKVRDAATAIQDLPPEVKTKVGIDEEDSVDTIIEKMKTLDPDDEIFLKVNAEDSISSTDELKKTIDEIKDKDVTITVKVDDTEFLKILQLKNTLSEIKEEIQANVIPSVDEDGQAALDTLIQKISELEAKTVDEIADVQGTDDVDALKKAIDRLYSKTVYERASVSGTDDVNKLKDAINALKDKRVSVTYVRNNITNNQTNYGGGILPFGASKEDYVGSADGTALTFVNGSAFADGTTFPLVDGNAFADGSNPHRSGDWAVKESGVSLGGEEGQELVVRKGRFFTIGDKAAEFFRAKIGDIIFNAQQTKQIFKYGKILHGKKRGKSYATGTAYADASTGSGKRYRPSSWSPSSSSNYTPSSSYNNTGNTVNTSGETAFEKFQNWLNKLFDWIEIKLERQTRKIERYTARADAALEAGNYGNSAANYRNAVSASSVQVTNNEAGAKKYKETADKVLSNAVAQGIISTAAAKGIASGVADGRIDIREYSDEVQEVISAYQQWYEKSLSCADAVETLHQEMRKYVQNLKDVRDTQRDVALESSEMYSAISTSGYVGSDYAHYGLAKSQLAYSNKQLDKQNAAYRQEVSGVTYDAKKLGSTAKSAVGKQLKTSSGKKKNSAYNKALKNAQAAIKSLKPVSSNDLNTVKKYSTSTYEQLYAYNLQLENVETAKLEQASAYAANSTEIFGNIAKTYENKDAATNYKLDLYQQRAENATSAKSANSHLSKAVSQYNAVLKDDKAEVSKYSGNVKSNLKTVMKSNKSQRGKNYSGLSKTGKSNVDKCIDSAQEKAKKGETIPAGTLAQLAQYYSKGYVTLAFYQSCINYNNALEHKRQAEAQYEIDKETAKAEKESIGKQMLDNVMDEYAYRSDTNAAKTTAIQTAQSLKTTKGNSLTKSDYNNLIKQSKADQKIYSNEVTAINKQIQSNIKTGVWTKSSKEYKDAVLTLEEYKDKVNQCVIQQESWNNEIANLPYERIKKSLDLLDAVAGNNKSLIEWKSSKGLDLEMGDYETQMKDNKASIAKLREEQSQAYSDYLKALANAEGVYGGKTADEWKQKYLSVSTEINNTLAANEKLKDSAREDVLFRQFERAYEASKALRNSLESISELIHEDMLFDDGGRLTDMGFSQLGVRIKEMESYRNDIETALAERQQVLSLRGKDGYSELEYTEDLRKAEEHLQEAIRNTSSARAQVIDIIKEQSQAELDAVLEVIDARQELYKKKKDYYDYDKQLKDKSKEIQLLQSQVAALDGVADAESRAQKARLEAQLQEAQDDMEETVKEHVYDLQISGLDDLKTELQDGHEEYIKTLNSNLEVIVDTVASVTQSINGNADSINMSLQKLLDSFNVSGLDASAVGIPKFANGTKHAGYSGYGITQDDGREIVLKDGSVLLPINTRDGVVPNELTENLLDLAKDYPNMKSLFSPYIPKVVMPDYTTRSNDVISPVIQCSITIQGNANEEEVIRAIRKEMPGISKKVQEDIRKDIRKRG